MAWRLLLLGLALGGLSCSASAGGEGPGASGGTGGGPSGGTGGVAGENSGTGGSVIAVDAGTGGAGDGSSEVCQESVDIVFVMDVSTTMGPFLSKLASEIDAVDQAASNLGLPSPPRYGLVVFVDDVLFVNNKQPYSSAAQLKADFQTWSAFAASNQQVGGGNSNYTFTENSLDALYAAATEFAWRPVGTVQRLIIHTTDDAFWQGPQTQNGVNIQYNYGQVLQALQQNQIRTFSFASKIGGQCNCLDVSAGWFGPYVGSPSLPSATGGDAFELDQVMAGQVSLSASITGAVEESLCEPYPTPR